MAKNGMLRPIMEPQKEKKIQLGCALRKLREGSRLSRKALGAALNMYEKTILNAEAGASGGKATRLIARFFGYENEEELLAKDDTDIRRQVQLRTEYTDYFKRAKLAAFGSGRTKLAQAANLLETDVINAERGLASAEMMDALAKAMGCSSSEEFVSRGRSGTLGSLGFMDKVFLATGVIDKAFKLDALEQAVAFGQFKRKQANSPTHVPELSSDIPVFDMQALPASEILFSEPPQQTLPGWLGESVGPQRLFAVSVAGSMMEPDYFHGDIVICAEDALHEKGAVAVVRLASGEQGLALVQRMADDKVLLSYKNTQYIPKLVSEEELVFIAPVVKEIKNRRA